MDFLRKIIIRDETLRDGTQQTGVNLSEKDRINLAILSVQILNSSKSLLFFRNQINLGMPESSNFVFKVIKKTVEKLKDFNIDFFVTGTSRKKAIEIMAQSLQSVVQEKKIIAPFLGISYIHRKKIGLTKLQTLKKAIKMVKFAKKLCSRVYFPLEGGYYAYLEEPSFVIELLKELERLGVEGIPFCDTVGTSLPFSGKRIISYGKAIKEIKNCCPNLKISVHCHNDYGLAIANSLEGIIIGGAEVVDGTFLGIGERCGNASLETLLVILKNKGRDLGLKINADISNLYFISKKIAKILGINIPKNSPIVGKNAFSHVAGIHQDGTLKNKKTYESFEPKKIGRPGHKIILSSLSGRKGIKYILEKKFNLKNIEEETLQKVIKRFKNLENFKNKDPEKLILKILSQVLIKQKTKNKK